MVRNRIAPVDCRTQDAPDAAPAAMPGTFCPIIDQSTQV
jgi:hypothetical protein